MVKYGDDDEVSSLLVPSGDTNRLRVRRLLDEVYALPFSTIRSIDDVTLLGKEFQVPLTTPVELRGTLERPADPAQLTNLVLRGLRPDAPRWIPMELDVRVTAKVEITAGALEGLEGEDLTDVTSLADFESRFDVIDMPAFMAEAGASTLEELKARLPQKLRLLYAQPPAFDPDDPAATRRFRLAVCVLFEPALDLEAALRAVREAREAAAAARPFVGEANGGEVRAPAAWMVVFPRSALTPQLPAESDVDALFATADAVAAFEDPT
jgi:hypothetical protein